MIHKSIRIYIYMCIIHVQLENEWSVFSKCFCCKTLVFESQFYMMEICVAKFLVECAHLHARTSVLRPLPWKVSFVAHFMYIVFTIRCSKKSGSRPEIPNSQVAHMANWTICLDRSRRVLHFYGGHLKFDIECS